MLKAVAFSVFVSLLCLFFARCVSRDNDNTSGKIETRTEKANVELNNVKNERRQLSEDLRKLRNKINKRIEKISDQLDLRQTSEQSKVTLRQQQEELTQQRSKIEKAINEVENSSDEAWADVKTGAMNTLNNVKGEVENEISG